MTELEILRPKIENIFGTGACEVLQDYASMNATGKAEVRKYAHSLTFDPAYKGIKARIGNRLIIDFSVE